VPAAVAVLPSSVSSREPMSAMVSETSVMISVSVRPAEREVPVVGFAMV
jgi:hypothetical protein